MSIDLSANPFLFGSQLQQSGEFETGIYTGLFDYVSLWFVRAAKGLKVLKQRIKVELCIDDTVQILEQIQYGISARREAYNTDPVSKDRNTGEIDGTGKEDCESMLSALGKLNMVSSSTSDKYPKMYDRIHLSALPDFAGGSLTMFLVALPLTWPETLSYITANCLPNAMCFNTAADYNNEYLCLHTPSDLEKAFRVRMVPDQNIASTSPVDPEMTHYHKWQLVPTKSRQMWDLKSRSAFETWLYRVFVKLSIPVFRTPYDITLIHSPLNLTAFVHLCIHLHNSGYLAHWMSTVLDNILSGSITTKARPPRSDPLTKEESTADVSALKQSTAPFTAELSTIVSIWQSVLPFGILTPNLPLWSNIRKYSLKWAKRPDEPPSHIRAFVLVFLSTYSICLKQNTFEIILSTTSWRIVPVASAVRDRSLHVLTTWQWDQSSNIATFWMRKDVLLAMEKRDWRAAIFRTDCWCCEETSSYTVVRVRAL